MEILPPAGQEDKRTKPITIASLQASVLPMVSLSLRPGTLPAQALTPAWAWTQPMGIQASCSSRAMLGRRHSTGLKAWTQQADGPTSIPIHPLLAV